MNRLREEIPQSFEDTLAGFGIDVKGKPVLEVGSGSAEQFLWLAMMGAEKVHTVDPVYRNPEIERKTAYIKRGYSVELLDKVRFI